MEARRLADEHQVGARVAGAEDDLRPSLREPAARAAARRRRVRLRASRAAATGTALTGGESTSARPTDTIRARQRPRGASTSISSPGSLPSSACPTGESGETPPTLVISISIVVAVVPLELDARADGDDAARRRRLLVDDRRVLEPVAQHPDPRLEQSLLVLRRVVLEVLGEIAVRPRGRDRLARPPCASGPSSSASSASSCCVRGAASAARRSSPRPRPSGRSRRSRRSSRRRRRRLATFATPCTAKEENWRETFVAAQSGHATCSLAADELLEVRLALHADVFVDRHGSDASSRRSCRSPRCRRTAPGRARRASPAR